MSQNKGKAYGAKGGLEPSLAKGLKYHVAMFQKSSQKSCM
jgi:hypothetical protein